MNQNEFELSGPPLREEQIASLEEQLSTSLPEDYRKFLLSYNGGVPRKACFPWKNGSDLRWVDFLCWVDSNLATPSEDSEVETLAFAQFRDADIVPADALIIGSSCRDDLILLFIRGKRRGEVYLKYVDDLPLGPRESWRKDPERGLYRIAESFTGFLRLLRECDGNE